MKKNRQIIFNLNELLDLLKKVLFLIQDLLNVIKIFIIYYFKQFLVKNN